MNSIKSKVFASIDDVRREVLDKMNQDAPKAHYKLDLTPKYLKITSGCCKKF